MPGSKPPHERVVSTYCYQCVAGPDLLTVRIQDGVATEINPNFKAAAIHPGGGKACVKAFGLVQKSYSPNRVLYPMKRTNPKKGRHEDPGFVRISWDEALDLVADKLKAARAAGLTDESGYPRLAASFGGGGTPTAYMGTLPAFLSAWGPVDLSFGSGQGVKCTHSEHLYGELWHRAFTVCPDTPLCEYVLSFGANVEASGGVCGVKRHADARKRGMKRVQIEPHLSVTGACSAEWIPIKPKTDAAFLFAMIHVLLHETAREKLDIPFLKERTSSPYLIGPGGFFLRDPETQEAAGDRSDKRAARCRSTPPISIRRWKAPSPSTASKSAPMTRPSRTSAAAVSPAFAHLVAHVKNYSPEWAAAICDVPAATIRRVTNEFLAHAHVGETIEIEGMTLPFRPVAIAFGKTVNNGWGGYECCWARTLIPCLVGALDVPGGTLGTTVRLNRPADNRWSSVTPGPDGFMHYPMNPTGKDEWISRPTARSAHRTLVPLVANSRLEPGARPDASCLDDAEGGFRRAPACRPARRLAGLPHQSGDFVLGHQGGRRDHGQVSVHRLLRPDARRNQSRRRRAAARLHRSRRPAVDAHRRHQIHRAVLGTSGLRSARSGGAAARRGARLHLDLRPNWRAAPACSRNTTRRSIAAAPTSSLRARITISRST